MANAPIIGLVGKKRSGKDTFAQRLVDRHGFVRIAFADALKQCALHLDPIVDVLERDDDTDPSGVSAAPVRLSRLVASAGWDHAKADPEVRRLLQDLGTGIRAIDSNFWIKAALAEMDKHPDVPIVVTDVRFANEAELIGDSWVGWLVRIIRPELDDRDGHVSEMEQDAFEVNVEVVNGSDVAHLHDRADILADFVLGKGRGRPLSAALGLA